MQNSAQGWHVAEWGLWGWVETIFKVIALIAGIAAFFGSNAANSLTIGGNPHLAAGILLALLTLLSLVALTIRFQQKEIISLIFGIVNFLGHLGLLIAILRLPESMTFSIVFGVFYTVGQLTKLQFLNTSGYTESGQTQSGMLRFAIGMPLPTRCSRFSRCYKRDLIFGTPFYR
jgi:hypothetical protein